VDTFFRGSALLSNRRTLPGGSAAAETLTQKVLKGGGGVWGEIPMLPHPQHSAEEARAMVETILYLNQLKGK